MVWILFYHGPEDDVPEIKGVFSTESLAKEYEEQHCYGWSDSWYIESYHLD